MSDAAITITLLLTVCFAFGMAIGSQLERSRHRRRNAQKEIDWMLEELPAREVVEGSRDVPCRPKPGSYNAPRL